MLLPYELFLKCKYDKECLHLESTGLHYTVQIYNALELQPELISVRDLLAKLLPILSQAGIRKETMDEVFMYAYALDKAILGENFAAISIFDTHAVYLWKALVMELRWTFFLSTCSGPLLLMLGDNVKHQNFCSVDVLLSYLRIHPTLVDINRDIVLQRHQQLHSQMSLFQ
jgi:hypothetical protein